MAVAAFEMQSRGPQRDGELLGKVLVELPTDAASVESRISDVGFERDPECQLALFDEPPSGATPA